MLYVTLIATGHIFIRPRFPIVDAIIQASYCNKVYQTNILGTLCLLVFWYGSLYVSSYFVAETYKDYQKRVEYMCVTGPG